MKIKDNEINKEFRISQAYDSAFNSFSQTCLQNKETFLGQLYTETISKANDAKEVENLVNEKATKNADKDVKEVLRAAELQTNPVSLFVVKKIKLNNKNHKSRVMLAYMYHSIYYIGSQSISSPVGLEHWTDVSHKGQELKAKIVNGVVVPRISHTNSWTALLKEISGKKLHTISGEVPLYLINKIIVRVVAHSEQFKEYYSLNYLHNGYIPALQLSFAFNKFTGTSIDPTSVKTEDRHTLHSITLVKPLRSSGYLGLKDVYHKSCTESIYVYMIMPYYHKYPSFFTYSEFYTSAESLNKYYTKDIKQKYYSIIHNKKYNNSEASNFMKIFQIPLREDNDYLVDQSMTFTKLLLMKAQAKDPTESSTSNTIDLADLLFKDKKGMVIEGSCLEFSVFLPFTFQSPGNKQNQLGMQRKLRFRQEFDNFYIVKSLEVGEDEEQLQSVFWLQVIVSKSQQYDLDALTSAEYVAKTHGFYKYDILGHKIFDLSSVSNKFTVESASIKIAIWAQYNVKPVEQFEDTKVKEICADPKLSSGPDTLKILKNEHERKMHRLKKHYR